MAVHGADSIVDSKHIAQGIVGTQPTIWFQKALLFVFQIWKTEGESYKCFKVFYFLLAVS